MHFIVYALTDPRTDEVRYVGKSCNGMQRPKAHRSYAMNLDDKTHRARWIRSLVADDLIYGVIVLETCSSKAALTEAEIRWIAIGHQLGWRLTNGTPGGDGGGRAWTPEQKAKLSATRTGKPNLGALGKRRPDVTARNRQPQSKETIAKRAAGLVGNRRALGCRERSAARAWLEELILRDG